MLCDTRVKSMQQYLQYHDTPYHTLWDIFRRTLRRCVHVMSSQIRLLSLCNLASTLLKALNFSAIFSLHLIACRLGQFVFKILEKNRRGARRSRKLNGRGIKSVFQSIYRFISELICDLSNGTIYFQWPWRTLAESAFQGHANIRRWIRHSLGLQCWITKTLWTRTV